MNEFAQIGKAISILFALFIYAYAWGCTLAYKTYCNKYKIWKVILARLFIGLHIVALIVWSVWSWTI